MSAVKAGAADYLAKPLHLDELLHRIHQIQDRRRLLTENRELREALAERHRVEGIIGESGAMQEVLSVVRRVAPSDATVLIRGESGTGKELIARAIHYASPRAARALVKVNCAALAESLLETELFGHEKGAYTGAVNTKQGLLEVAHRGVVFLDEIGDLDPQVQPKLLKVLEEKRFRRLGDVRDRQVDVQLVAASHQSLPQLVQEKKFRSDLYYRISTIPLRVPALRERAEDIPVLARQLLAIDMYQLALGDTIGVGVPSQTVEILQALFEHYPKEKIGLHLHDTRGTALANALVGVQQGITSLDSSVGGLGGCPYAPGASGNVATEDVVYMLQGMGVQTGVDLDKLVAISARLGGQLGRELPSKYLKAHLGHCARIGRPV